MSDSKQPQAMPTGPERELQIYALGLGGGKPSVPVPLDLLEQKAKEVLAPRAYDYVAGGAGGEDTMRANREAFYRWRIVPRMLRDVSKRDLSVELLGARLPAPVLLGPVGVQEIVHGEADMASARAASSLGLPFVLSTMSSRSIEEVAQSAEKVAESPRWFQLYWGKNPELTASMVQRAERAGFTALVVTLDTHSLGWRERRSRIRRRRFSFGAACFRIRRSRGRISDFCGSTHGCRSSSKEYCVPMMRRGRWRRGWTR